MLITSFPSVANSEITNTKKVKMKYNIVLLLLLLSGKFVFGQTVLTGKIIELSNKDSIAIPGATIRWLNASDAVYSNSEGNFKINKTAATNKLIVSYVGYNNDTLMIDTMQTDVLIVLSNIKTLKQVDIVYRKKGSEYSMMNTLKTENITQKELAKAACCNLSESFETNASVDVNFADAVTGTKQIQMLGLSGQYSLITKENMPYMRGLASSYGLTFIPGTWIQSIQLSKGAGSVVNGYESFTGQINTELQKPDNSEKLFFNTYVNSMGRNEYNLNLSKKLNETWSTALLLHSNFSPFKIDMNNDGFLDLPLGKQYNILNRWAYITKKGFQGQIGGSYVEDERTGGQKTFSRTTERLITNPYGIGLNAKKYDVFAKNAYIFQNKAETSMGLQLSYTNHDQRNFYGINNYNGLQQTVYANYIFQSIIKTTAHKYKIGASYMLDDVNETYKKITYKRQESIPGIFGEYTYSYLAKFNMVAGMRADYNNYYGIIYTPRLHLRYSFNENNTAFRLSAGRALKTANIFSENAGLMASSRDFQIIPNNVLMPYGLRPEIAWNYGINMIHQFKLDYRDAQFTIDVYRTDFVNQVVIDLDNSAQQVLIYNLSGKSYSNTIQTELSWEVINRLDMKVAYRYIDTKTQYRSGLLEKYLLSKHRAFINLGYETKNQKWQYDFTCSYNGRKRIPITMTNPLDYRREEYSKGFFILNAQTTYKTLLKGKLELYAGIENLLNTKMPNPIISANDPFGKHFDSSLVWGPIVGRMYYGGLRFKIK